MARSEVKGGATNSSIRQEKEIKAYKLEKKEMKLFSDLIIHTENSKESLKDRQNNKKLNEFSSVTRYHYINHTTIYQ
jgi:hypothetical protein